MLILNINGIDLQVDASPDMPLLWAIRDLVGLKGTKYSCGVGQCGACTVHVDGQARLSCVTPLTAVKGKAITTIEGLKNEAGRAVQTAWKELAVPQCGFCQPGQIMAATGLLMENPSPSDQEITVHMANNICRCCAYQRITQAVRRASDYLG